MRRVDITDADWVQAKAELLDAMRQGARAGQALYYSELAARVQAFPLSHRSRHLNDLLDEIAREHLEAAGCIVTAAVVRKSTHSAQPGRRFFGLAHRLGLYSAGGEETPAEFASRQRKCALTYLGRR